MHTQRKNRRITGPEARFQAGVAQMALVISPTPKGILVCKMTEISIIFCMTNQLLEERY
jgi:hypothetical protein